MDILKEHFTEIIDLFKVAPWAVVIALLAWQYKPLFAKAIEEWEKKPSVDVDTLVETVIKRLDQRYVQIPACHTHIDKFREEMNLNFGTVHNDIGGVYSQIDKVNDKLFSHADRGGGS